jgi:hypothetical protein
MLMRTEASLALAGAVSMATSRVPQCASATALHGWEAEEDDELSFPEGAKIVDIVLVLRHFS